MSAEGSSAGALRTERPRCASATLDVTEESVEFFSPNFDACAVLAAPRVRLPTGFEEVRPLDNLSAARQLIPEIWAASSAPPTGPRHAAARPAATPVAAPAASLVQLWNGQCKCGPLRLLRDLHRQRVRVVVRRRRGLRGWCEGLLQLYDRHFNLVLADAVEHTAAFGLVESDAAGVDEAWRWVRRTAAQLLVRGECVVSVCSAVGPPETGLHAPAQHALLQRAAEGWATEGGR
jgi:small nuclear ribonucleoprotein (snRNP)-like protein